MSPRRVPGRPVYPPGTPVHNYTTPLHDPSYQVPVLSDTRCIWYPVPPYTTILLLFMTRHTRYPSYQIPVVSGTQHPRTQLYYSSSRPVIPGTRPIRYDLYLVSGTPVHNYTTPLHDPSYQVPFLSDTICIRYPSFVLPDTRCIRSCHTRYRSYPTVHDYVQYM